MGKCLCQLESREWMLRTHTPSTDAADTSSFTLSRQRENIAGVEVGRGTDFSLWLAVVHRLKSMLQRLPAGET